ncbi:MAG: glycosyltransferase family 2 protein [Tannerellaceae bacterium]|jgi:glycosyltransferase involved in cell wall biosynthesis|nr:glycosyltransferase family 2 protein [Tannerellaceae bacterium]
MVAENVKEHWKEYKRLSILIPAYNEERTIGTVLDKVIAVHLPEGMEREIIVIDDCSTDGTAKQAKAFGQSHPDLKLVYGRHDVNRGKGAAVRTAISLSTGDFIIIQDADAEYDPEDYNALFPFLLSGERVIYGSRFLRKGNNRLYFSFYWGNRLATLATNILYFQKLTDMETCYKMFDAALLKSIPLQCESFEFEPEVTAKLSRLGYRIKEAPICYTPRSVEGGKKIKWLDGVEAIWTLLRYRFWKPKQV